MLEALAAFLLRRLPGEAQRQTAEAMTVRELSPLVRYEALADLFYECHRMLAPGKDAPAGFGRDSDDCVFRWYSMREMLGPSDLAAVLSVAILRESSE